MTGQPGTDKQLLQQLDQKLQLIRDRVRGVAEGYANGFFLWGEGGTSKSYTVVETLKEIGRPYKLTSGRLTGKGLFELLRDDPDLVHVLDDVQSLFNDRNALGVLKSALWGQDNDDGRQERPIEWVIAGKRDVSVFTGGIIIIANCRLDDVPDLRALKTRLGPLQYRPTTEEIAALMRHIASQGHRHGPYFLAPAACLEVAEEIINRSQRLQRGIDIRLYICACKDRLQWANGESETDWREILESRMKEAVLAPGGSYESRADRKERELAIARRIAALPPKERLEVWVKETGKSRPALYRHLEELRKESSHLSRLFDQRDGGWASPSDN